MNVYDKGGRFAAQNEPSYLVRRVAEEEGLTLTFREWYPHKRIPLMGGPEREADLVALADEVVEPDEGSLAWLLIYEMQSRHDPEKAAILLLEAATYLVYAKDTQRERPLRPLPVFVYLQGSAPDQGVVGVRTPAGRGFGCEPVLILMQDESAALTLGRVAAGRCGWGALFWVVLMAGADDEAVIDLWLRLRDELVPARMRPNLTLVVLTFAELAKRRKQWERIKGGVKMTESPFLNEVIEERMLEEMRGVVLEVIEGRFPEMTTPDVRQAIADQPDMGLLRSWVSAAVRAKTAAELLAVLRQ